VSENSLFLLNLDLKLLVDDFLVQICLKLLCDEV
jgi:hypothetical protein